MFRKLRNTSTSKPPRKRKKHHRNRNKRNKKKNNNRTTTNKKSQSEKKAKKTQKAKKIVATQCYICHSKIFDKEQFALPIVIGGGRESKKNKDGCWNCAANLVTNYSLLQSRYILN